MAANMIARWFGRSTGIGADVPSVSSKPKNWLDPEEDSFIPDRDLWIGPDDSIVHYTRWVWEYLAYLTLITGLKRDQAVLDLGCGLGRIARGLLTYLRSPGRYVGLDIDAKRIDDASRRFTARWANFEFVCADIRNAHYNPLGTLDSATYTFPFADGTFDVIFAASLFTHLLPAETANYFRESRRVLKPSGACLFSCFLLDHYRGPGTTISPMYEFTHSLPETPGVSVRDPDYPDAAVAYSLRAVTALANDAGLNVVKIFPGLWSEGESWAVNEQDLVFLAPQS